MADTNAKVDVTRNGRGQIISYGIENTNTYSPILLSDRVRQLLKKYNRSSFLDNVDAEFSEFTEIQGLLDLGLAAETSTEGRIYIEIPREVDLQYIADLSELVNVGAGNVPGASGGQGSGGGQNSPTGNSGFFSENNAPIGQL